MKTTTLTLTLALLLAAATATAQTTREQIEANPALSAGNYLQYPYLTQEPPAPLAAPAGYKPVYISHYGRHGSRWLINESQYSQPVQTLRRARRAGVLTPLGKQTLRQLEQILTQSRGRLGELTPKGADQHRAIARRMAARFPQLFAGADSIDARSTIVVRCILSMENAMQELKAHNPSLRIRHDASRADMWYMDYDDDGAIKAYNDTAKALVDAYRASHTPTQRFMAQLISDTRFIADSVDAPATMRHIFDICSNQQSHYGSSSLYHLFTTGEAYNLWAGNNLLWYTGYGPWPVTGGRGLYSQVNLLNDILARAEEALRQGSPAATLRYGHDNCLLPLVCLLGINNFNTATTDPDTLPEIWRDYDIFPMACNLQLVFYRNPALPDDARHTLVQVLLNETPATIAALAQATPGFYSWSQLRTHCQNIISQFKARNNP